MPKEPKIDRKMKVACASKNFVTGLVKQSSLRKIFCGVASTSKETSALEDCS